MRSFLFRGKNVDNNEWVYGSLIQAANFCCILENEEDVHPMDYPYLDGELGVIDGMVTPVIPETVGMYTGLLDKNGRLIFEGDVLDTPRWVVSYCANCNDGLGMNAGWYIQRDDFESWKELENEEWHEVLGNKWDNPELLKR